MEDVGDKCKCVSESPTPVNNRELFVTTLYALYTLFFPLHHVSNLCTRKRGCCGSRHASVLAHIFGLQQSYKRGDIEQRRQVTCDRFVRSINPEYLYLLYSNCSFCLPSR